MSPPHERNLPTGGPPRRPDRRGPGPRRRPAEAGDGEWLWGVHAVEAALANPDRTLLRLACTADRAPALERLLSERGEAAGVRLEATDAGEVGRLLPPGAAHQGVALRAEPLEGADLDAIAARPHGVILLLDGVTDPQNVGAILRSAQAFGARGVVMQDRRAPPLAGAAAKAAAGAVERLPVARVVNLSRALDRLADLGWRAVGLSGAADPPLEAVLDGGPTVLVLGSEGDGLRRLVAEHCDALARIGMPGGMESLNVGAAAAVSLYAASRATADRGTADRGTERAPDEARAPGERA